MIAIFSTVGLEASSEQVMEWILHLGGSCVRINGEELPGSSFSFELDDDDDGDFFMVDDQKIALKDIHAVWYRRTGAAPQKGLASVQDVGIRQQAAGHLGGEVKALKRSLYHRLRHARWVSHTDTSSPNKFAMLQEARNVGLHVPRTLLTTARESLSAFQQKVGPIIIKPISDTCMYRYEGALYNQYTTSLDVAGIEALPEKFFPVLAQERIDKTFEIRCFFFRGECFPMAIFSQSDAQTTEDFRVYNYKKRARTIPYKLDNETCHALRQLMARLDLETGSVDFMKGKDGKLYFLEVNPVGQFGMVSHPCNYRLERRLAQHLIEEDAACRN